MHASANSFAPPRARSHQTRERRGPVENLEQPSASRLGNSFRQHWEPPTSNLLKPPQTSSNQQNPSILCCRLPIIDQPVVFITKPPLATSLLADRQVPKNHCILQQKRTTISNELTNVHFKHPVSLRLTMTITVWTFLDMNPIHLQEMKPASGRFAMPNHKSLQQRCMAEHKFPTALAICCIPDAVEVI